MRARRLPLVASAFALAALLAAHALGGPKPASSSTASSGKPASSAKPAPTATPKPSASPAAKPAPAKPPAKPAPKPVAKPTAKKPTWGASAAYQTMVKTWHLGTGMSAPTDAKGRAKLVIYSINRDEKVELTPSTDDGAFAPTEIDKASWIMRSADGSLHPIDARLLDIVYALQKHFKASEVRMISGYRAPLKRLGSNHGYGRAMDLVIPGTIDDWVAQYVRALGYSGAGVYLTSGFVHVDVRERSYYWLDKSGPGQTNKAISILATEAAANDAKAKKAGRIGPPSPKIGRDVDDALVQRVKAVTGSTPPVDVGDDATTDDDDDDDEKS